MRETRDISLSTGIPSLDNMIEQVMLGDNIVWLVSSPEQYDYFVSRFVEHAVAQRRPLTYVHFDERIDYSDLASARDVKMIELDPEEGPAAALDLLTERIAVEQPGAHYLFDALSVLCRCWQDEDAFVDFFRSVCPLLYEVEAVAYFALLKGQQSNSTVARVRDTTQILIEVYEQDGMVMLRPIKVWDRYSERMFHPHVLSGGQLIPAEALPALQGAAAPSEADLIAGYHERAGDERSLSTREELIRSIISNRPEYIRIARDHFSVRDLMDIKSRIVGGGLIGGKAAGMLLSNRILRAAWSREGGERLGQLQPPESYFVGSGVYFNFLINNNLMHWLDLKHQEPAAMRAAAEQLRADFEAGEFPRAVREGLRRIVRRFVGRPLIVRSSSLLEDSFETAFAGKYESVFLGNQGEPNECLEGLLGAIRQVYASSLGTDALAYRRRHGLLEFQERMAVLIQAVEGGAYRGLHFPPVAGVAFSRNPYPWNERIDTRAGLVRLVFGLGTRAVNRVEADYPRLVALSHPGLHPDGDYASSVRYHQRHMDAINLETNRLETVSIRERIGADHPAAFYVFSLFRDGFMRPPISRRLAEGQGRLTVSFQNLIGRTDFVDLMRQVLETIEEQYRYPVASSSRSTWEAMSACASACSSAAPSRSARSSSRPSCPPACRSGTCCSPPARPFPTGSCEACATSSSLTAAATTPSPPTRSAPGWPARWGRSTSTPRWSRGASSSSVRAGGARSTSSSACPSRTPRSTTPRCSWRWPVRRTATRPRFPTGRTSSRTWSSPASSTCPSTRTSRPPPTTRSSSSRRATSCRACCRTTVTWPIT
jgi:hypothetical protein